MNPISAHPNTNAGTIWPQSHILRSALLVALGTVLLWISAKIQVPFYPVPMTMQTFVVLALGAAYGWRLGGLTVLAYLAEGAFGLPVFAGTPEKGIGLAYMARNPLEPPRQKFLLFKIAIPRDTYLVVSESCSC